MEPIRLHRSPAGESSAGVAEEKLNELTGQNVDHNMEGMKME